MRTWRRTTAEDVVFQEAAGFAAWSSSRLRLRLYTSIFERQGDRPLTLYEAEDQYFGRLLGVADTEIFKSASPILLPDPRVILPGVHG